MPRCPNCFYELVLLEKRRKYKCAKCGKLFPQKEIDDKEFRERNKKRREQAKKEARREYHRSRRGYQRKYVHENKDKECKVLFVDFIVHSVYDSKTFGRQEDGTMVL